MAMTHTFTETVALPDLPAGVWRHYKGPLYQALGYAHDANSNSDIPRVVYIGLELDSAHLGPRLAVRDALRGGDAWFDIVCNYDDGEDVCGRQLARHGDEPGPCLRHTTETSFVQRFTYVGAEFTGY